MRVNLVRSLDNGTVTLGDLFVYSDSQELEFQSKTIERPYLGNQHIISCIPAGEYKCEWGFMEKHNVHHYELLNVPDRSGIFIHIASRVDQLEGCIALVKSYVDNNGIIIGVDSKVAVNAFETLLNKEPFRLIIIDIPNGAGQQIT